MFLQRSLWFVYKCDIMLPFTKYFKKIDFTFKLNTQSLSRWVETIYPRSKANNVDLNV